MLEIKETLRAVSERRSEETISWVDRRTKTKRFEDSFQLLNLLGVLFTAGERLSCLAFESIDWIDSKEFN